ncbi:MAG: DUF481 domain-containing protein [Gemmatimonadota bacterium]|nr:DUF481 domain-containing protein [Gemmatimonadota bacterium]
MRPARCFTHWTVALALTAFAGSLSAQDPDFVWDNGTEVGFVTTSGNSSSTTFSLKSALTGTGGPNQFKIEAGAIRASSSTTTRRAVGTTGSFDLEETTTAVESAANYFARARFDRDVGVGFAFAGGGWERNTFAGFNHRISTVAGVGKTWVDNDNGRFKTDVGGTYTIQKDIDDDPDEKDGFGGIRSTIEAARALSATTELETIFVADENLANTDDFRFDWISSLSVALTEGLAFKTSYQLIFDNDPARIRVPLFDGGGAETGTVGIPSNEFDSLVTLSLVIKL